MNSTHIVFFMLAAAAYGQSTSTTKFGNPADRRDAGDGNYNLAYKSQKSGKVVTQDGSPLPEPAEIVALCGSGAAQPLAKTDSKGGFVIGSGWSGQADSRLQRNAAGFSGPAGGKMQKLAGCTLEARLQGFRSSSLPVLSSTEFDLGTIVVTRREGTTGTTISATAAMAPKDARQSFEKAQRAIAGNRWDEARPLLEKAVAGYAGYAAAWTELGRAYQLSKDVPRARDAFEHAIKAEPVFITPYLHLAMVHAAARDWQAAADTTAAVIRLDPSGHPAAYALNATSNLRLGNNSAAEASARKGVELGAQRASPELEYVLGMALAGRGDKTGALEHLGKYLQLVASDPARAEAVKQKIEEIEKGP